MIYFFLPTWCGGSKPNLTTTISQLVHQIPTIVFATLWWERVDNDILNNMTKIPCVIPFTRAIFGLKLAIALLTGFFALLILKRVLLLWWNKFVGLPHFVVTVCLKVSFLCADGWPKYVFSNIAILIWGPTVSASDDLWMVCWVIQSCASLNLLEWCKYKDF